MRIFGMNRPSHPPGRPEATENAKIPRPDPYRRALPQPPPPRLRPRSSLPGRYGFDNVIPARSESAPETDWWCLRLLTSMQRGCDTLNPLVSARSGRRGFCERAGVPLMRRRGSATQRNQRLGTPGRVGGSRRVTPPFRGPVSHRRRPQGCVRSRPGSSVGGSGRALYRCARICGR